MAKIINLKNFKDKRGTLTVIEKEIKFKIKRVYYIYNAVGIRGNTDIKKIYKHLYVLMVTVKYLLIIISQKKIHLKQKK